MATAEVWQSVGVGEIKIMKWVYKMEKLMKPRQDPVNASQWNVLSLANVKAANTKLNHSDLGLLTL